MDIGTIILWVVILGAALTFGQFIINFILGLIMWVIILIGSAIGWLYNVITGRN